MSVIWRSCRNVADLDGEGLPEVRPVSAIIVTVAKRSDAGESTTMTRVNHYRLGCFHLITQLFIY